MMNNSKREYDILVIGGGMSGLLSAARLGQAGRKVLLVEKLSFLGGRFSAFSYQGSEVSSGAFHTIPHGNEGPLAQALRRIGVHVDIDQPSLFASFFFDNKQVKARYPWDTLNVVSKAADKRMVWRAFFHLWFRSHYPGSIADWLNHLGATLEVRRIYDRFCQFALSTGIEQVSYQEGRAVAEAIIRFGLPGVPVGGARALVKQISRAASAAGVEIWKAAQVDQLIYNGTKICGALVHLRRSSERVQVYAPVVISSIGPQPSVQLLSQSGVDAGNITDTCAFPPAVGLKIHVLSPTSLIDHAAIMFCLDTQRIAGVIQITNTDPSLAPPGKHLLISHQVLPPGADWQAEMELALQDWRYVFGAAFEHCEVLGCSQFPERYPVNWAAQGYDLRRQPFSEMGLWLVGDGMKPKGLMMVEGAAASAESTVNQILGIANITPWMPSRVQEVRTWVKRIKTSLRRGYDG